MAQPRTRKRVPQFDRCVLSDPDALALAIGELFEAEPAMRRHSRKIIRLQNRLRKLVSDKTWSAYLSLENAEAARLSDAVNLVASWAFLQGRKQR